MIDFHTHILPNIDDGSSSVQETAGLLAEEKRQGVECIVATPHFYANRIGVEEFLRRRERSIQEMNSHLLDLYGSVETDRVPKLRYGAEVYFFPGMGQAEKISSLCVTGTRQILVEMPFAQWNDSIYREIESIITRQRLHVVLAHVERYPEFQKDHRTFDRILELPLTIQLNGGSFINSRSKRKFCMNILKEFDNVILGSDTHNLTSRTPNLKEAREVIAKKAGQARLDMIDDLTQRLLTEG